MVHQGHKNNHELCMLQQNLTEFKGEVDKSAKIMGDFNISFSVNDQDDEKIRKDMEYLRHMI